MRFLSELTYTCKNGVEIISKRKTNSYAIVFHFQVAFLTSKNIYEMWQVLHIKCELLPVFIQAIQWNLAASDTQNSHTRSAVPLLFNYSVPGTFRAGPNTFAVWGNVLNPVSWEY